MSDSDCVIIGIGNPLRSDDGIGVHVIRYLRGKMPAGVDLVEGDIFSVDLLPHLENRRKVVFVDGIDAGEEPGAVFRFTPQQVPVKSGSVALSLHDYGLYDLVAAATLLDQSPGEVVLVAIQVKKLGWGETLSEELEAVIPEVRRVILKEIGAAE